MRNRISSASALGIIAVLVFLSGNALSQDIDTERFKSAVTPGGFVNAEGTPVRPVDDPWEFGASLNYQKNSLISVDDNGDLRDQFVAGRLGFNLIASMTVAEPFAIGVDMPVYVFQSGDAGPSAAGLGDLRIVPKFRLLDNRDLIGLALLLELRAPTHTGDFAGGARNVVVIPKVAIDHRFRGGMRIGGNLGVAIREDSSFANVTASEELTYAAAIGYRFGGMTGKTEIGGELNGAVGLTETDVEEAPLESFLYVRHNPNYEWEFQGGPGFGTIAGYGIPTFRVFAGVRYTPTSHDSDHDGISDADDQCPNVPEDIDRIEDLDGCPEEDPDSDRDGVADWEDDCPDAKETVNGVDDDDGCPDTGDPRVVYEHGEFVVLDHVEFETGSANLKSESHSLLDQVTLLVKQNPDVKIQVEGHTDSQGDADMNQRLSQQRAESVRRYMIDKGVSGDRLEAKGFGESKPLESGDSYEAMAANRRVGFVVIDGGGATDNDSE